MHDPPPNIGRLCIIDGENRYLLLRSTKLITKMIVIVKFFAISYPQFQHTAQMPEKQGTLAIYEQFIYTT
jgi:hypothetical protein